MTIHRFVPNSAEKIKDNMLKSLGLTSVEDLFEDIPSSLRIKGGLKIPDAISEIELERKVESKLEKNFSPPEYLSFLGGGAWLHYTPSIVTEIISRNEFYTSYTPYQPEISQGMLQSLFEYQSQICELTGMEVANSSMYDWGTALGEAGRMAFRVTRKRKIVVSRGASPERIAILRTYCYPASIDVKEVDFDLKIGNTDYSSVRSVLDHDSAALYIENPNFLGIIEESVDELSQLCHERNALLIVGVNPSTLGLMRPPGEYGADIVVGDGQPLGLPLNYGGPLIGIFATKKDPVLLRQMPGRLIGQTVSKDNSKQGYTMVLQTREQHIRREQATSNICTNEALLALAVSVYLSSMGPEGMKKLGSLCLANSHYAQKLLSERGMECPYFSGSFFCDLTVKTRLNSQMLPAKLARHKILGGIPLGRFYPDLSNVSLFSFSEVHTPEDVQTLVDALSQIDERE
jgi:glycine dehydrogenase subunit 1